MLSWNNAAFTSGFIYDQGAVTKNVNVTKCSVHSAILVKFYIAILL